MPPEILHAGRILSAKIPGIKVYKWNMKGLLNKPYPFNWGMTSVASANKVTQLPYPVRIQAETGSSDVRYVLYHINIFICHFSVKVTIFWQPTSSLLQSEGIIPQVSGVFFFLTVFAASWSQIITLGSLMSLLESRTISFFRRHEFLKICKSEF